MYIYICYKPGLVITKGSKIPDDVFEYIEVLIDEKYPFFSSINAAVTVNI